MEEGLFLSLKEIKILEDYESNLPLEEMSIKYEISLDDIEEHVKLILEKRDNLRILSRIQESSDALVRLREIDGRTGVPQKGTIKVGSQIIRYMSEGIYSSPAGSIKEIINNAFDADATEVKISSNEDRILIEDNGVGLDWKTFDEDFTFLAASIKRKQETFTKLYNRPIIGFLGIGFISVSELCDKLVITSCKKKMKIHFLQLK